MAKKRRKKSPPIRTGEAVPKERGQHNKIVLETIDRDASGRAYIRRQRILEECRLDSYLASLFLSDDEHEAGMKFRYAYLRFVYHVRVADPTNTFLNDTGGSNVEATMIAGIGSEELLKKIYKILTPSQRSIVIAVCGEDEFAGTTARKKTLKRALDKMARHWKLV